MIFAWHTSRTHIGRKPLSLESVAEVSVCSRNGRVESFTSNVLKVETQNATFENVDSAQHRVSLPQTWHFRRDYAITARDATDAVESIGIVWRPIPLVLI